MSSSERVDTALPMIRSSASSANHCTSYTALGIRFQSAWIEPGARPSVSFRPMTCGVGPGELRVVSIGRRPNCPFCAPSIP